MKDQTEKTSAESLDSNVQTLNTEVLTNTTSTNVEVQPALAQNNLESTGIPAVSTDNTGSTTVPFQAQPAKTETQASTNKKTPKEMLALIPKKIKIMGVVVFVMFIIIILTSMTDGGQRVRKQITDLVIPSASPIPTTVPVGENFPPSPYFSDPSVMALEEEVKKIETQINSTNLRDDSTRSPQLDWDVNFKK